MNSGNQKTHQEAVERWSAIIKAYGEACQEEPIPAYKWCEAYGINSVSFYRWKRYFQMDEAKREADSLRTVLRDRTDTADSSAPVFVDITSLAAARTPEIICSTPSPAHRPGTPSIMIQVEGVQIYVNDGVSEDTLATVLKAVRS
jgi:hypothetical protein